MEMERVVADAPRLVALLLRVGNLVRLTVDAWLHDVVPADGTVVDMDVPGPERHGIPLSDLEPLRRGCFDHFSLCLDLSLRFSD